MTTKIHAWVDALDNPVRPILITARVADITQGAALISHFETGVGSEGKRHDSGTLVQIAEEAGARAIIPPRISCKTHRTAN